MNKRSKQALLENGPRNVRKWQFSMEFEKIITIMVRLCVKSPVSARVIKSDCGGFQMIGSLFMEVTDD